MKCGGGGEGGRGRGEGEGERERLVNQVYGEYVVLVTNDDITLDGCACARATKSGGFELPRL